MRIIVSDSPTSEEEMNKEARLTTTPGTGPHAWLDPHQIQRLKERARCLLVAVIVPFSPNNPFPCL